MRGFFQSEGYGVLFESERGRLPFKMRRAWASLFKMRRARSLAPPFSGPAIAAHACGVTMPSPHHILSGLTAIAVEWRYGAIAWHVAFGLLVLLLAIGGRPPARVVAR